MRCQGLTRRRVLRSLTAALAAQSLPRVAGTHRAHVTLTRVVANRPQGTWEFTHSMHYEDASFALYQLTAGRSNDATSIAGRARLALEINRTMKWWDAAGAALTPSDVGAEIDGDSVLIYQELPAPKKAGRCKVEARLLQEIYPEQINSISLEFQAPFQLSQLNAQNPSAEFLWSARA